jgi:5-methyltetrahydrofolate--homocysteine methyltransferase
MAEYTSLAINAGAKIIGGCCGTAPEHISHMRSAIDNHVASNRPSIEQVIEKLGSLASPPAKEGARGLRGKRNRGGQ